MFFLISVFQKTFFVLCFLYFSSLNTLFCFLSFDYCFSKILLWFLFFDFWSPKKKTLLSFDFGLSKVWFCCFCLLISVLQQFCLGLLFLKKLFVLFYSFDFCFFKNFVLLCFLFFFFFIFRFEKFCFVFWFLIYTFKKFSFLFLYFSFSVF